MDLASLIGLVGGIGLMVFGIISNGGSIPSYLDLPSFIITFGGSLMSTMASFKLKDFINGLKGVLLTIQEPKVGNINDVITTIIDMSNVARKEGLLALEEAGGDVDDEFLKKGIMLVVDGTDPELVRGILETDLVSIETRHKKVIGVWEKWAEMGPAWGMIGTLIGLIQMLNNMSDASTIGPSMAVALITTLYGSVIANWLASPTAAKLAVNNSLEIMLKEITVEGLLSIQAGENPRVIEEKLKTFLPPNERGALDSDEEGGGEA
ncbi:MAG: motility protein A [Lachnospiraceae bacterium]|nr:motility protein A [Lachnospiraceae bacterium]